MHENVNFLGLNPKSTLLLSNIVGECCWNRLWRMKTEREEWGSWKSWKPPCNQGGWSLKWETKNKMEMGVRGWPYIT